MRLLLDESVPVGLRNHLRTHQVATVGEMGWGGSTNGALLGLAAKSFDALITVDKNLPHQQNLLSLPIAVVVLSARIEQLDRAFAADRQARACAWYARAAVGCRCQMNRRMRYAVSVCARVRSLLAKLSL